MAEEIKKIKKPTKKAIVAKVKIVKKKVKEKGEAPVSKVETVKIEKAKEVALPEKVFEKKKSYLYAVGRRKEAVAVVKLYKNGKGDVQINKKPCSEYFPSEELAQTVYAPLKSVGQADKIDIEAKVFGGGKRGQAEAVRLGITRALVQLNVNFRKNLRKAGFLTRDPRVKERKKYGLKRARRAPQWQKR